ncbi:hypothetical protein PF001_g25325, partial [Phytophthora fragariae]
MVSSAGEGESTMGSLQVPTTAYMEVSSPRIPSSATSSRAVNLRRRKIEIVEGSWRLVLILNADSTTVNGVYTYALLGLMAMFSCACMLLKGKRSEIPRDIHASWTVVVVGFVLIVVGIFANLLGDPKALMYFAIYFIIVMLGMFIMFERVTILGYMLVMLKKMAPSRYGKAAAVGLATGSSEEIEHTGARGGGTIARTIVSIRDAPIVFFCKVPDLTIINK